MGQDADDLTRRLQRLLTEWRLALRGVSSGAVTGSTAPEFSDLNFGLIPNALTGMHVPQVNCLASALQHAADKAMRGSSVVVEALKRVRLLINHVQRTPELRIKIQERLASQNVAALPSSLPREATWFQVYTVLQRLQAGRDCIHIVFTENREDVSALLPHPKETYALDALQVISRVPYFSNNTNHNFKIAS